MRAIVFDGHLKSMGNYPDPEAMPGWARIRVLKAGICTTDIEITRGYKGFKGVLGHEFVGVVDSNVPLRNAPDLTGKRVVGEINVGCGKCEQCRNGLERHCPHRKALGILDLDGCMADYCVLPLSNLHVVPVSMPDNRAVLVEPLSSAFEILDQIELTGSERAVVLGDGRLGILCAWALSTALPDVTLIGRHKAKLEKARWRELKTRLEFPARMKGNVDIVVEATGSTRGLGDAAALCRPRGTVVLKSTMASEMRVDMSAVVVNEQTLVGSRCGRFEMGLRMLASHPDMPLERLVSAEYPIAQALTAFEQAAQPDTLKVLIEIAGKG
jgi:alcohol dehydrogenase